MAQFARPSSDVSNTNWRTQTNSASNLWESIDEISPSDADYVGNVALGNLYNFSLSAVSDPGVSTGHILRWRSQWIAGPSSFTWNLTFRQGTTVLVTRVVSATQGLGWQTVSYTLSAAEADSITDYTALRMQFSVPQLVSEQVQVSWAELEVPNAGGDAISPTPKSRYVIGV